MFYLTAMVPACATFGPFFLVLGILTRTAPKCPYPRVAVACIVAGGVMMGLAMTVINIQSVAPR